MSTRRHLVIGAGPVGSGIATALAARGDLVTVVTRSGSGPVLRGVTLVKADASNAPRLAELAAGAVSIVNAANPPYHRWAEEWPPLHRSALDAAASSGALLVTMSNLYGYGPKSGVMSPDTPLSAQGTKGRARAEMWESAAAAHRDGRVRSAEVRAGDFVGPGVVDAHLGERIVPAVLSGKKVQLLGDPDRRHSFSYMPDVIATLLAVIDHAEVSGGRAWIAPVITSTQRDMIGALGHAAGTTSKVTVVPWWVVRAGGVAVRLFRELMETRYQWDDDFVADDSVTVAELGVRATPLAKMAGETVEWYRTRSGARAAGKVAA
jgi:nucleoside-diphosphate-sugar epimerase